MILLKITGKLASTPPTYDLLARDYFSLTVLLTARLQCDGGTAMLVKSLEIKQNHMTCSLLKTFIPLLEPSGTF